MFLLNVVTEQLSYEMSLLFAVLFLFLFRRLVYFSLNVVLLN